MKPLTTPHKPSFSVPAKPAFLSPRIDTVQIAPAALFSWLTDVSSDGGQYYLHMQLDIIWEELIPDLWNDGLAQA